jgi:hypothetical protein
MRHLRYPKLSPKILRRDQELWERIDEVLRRDPQIRRSAYHVLEAQRALRNRSNDLGWAAFLWLDEEYASRLALIAITLVRWAYWEGVGCQRPGPRPTDLCAEPQGSREDPPSQGPSCSWRHKQP